MHGPWETVGWRCRRGRQGETARETRPAAGNSRISRQYRGGRYEYDTAAGHRAYARTHTSPPRAHTFSRRQPTHPSAQPRSLSTPVGWRDPRLTRARPLFSTRRSFVDAVLFVIPFVIPLPLFVGGRRRRRCRCRRRVADAVIVGPRIAADKTGIVRRAESARSRDDGRANNSARRTARYE